MVSRDQEIRDARLGKAIDERHKANIPLTSIPPIHDRITGLQHKLNRIVSGGSLLDLGQHGVKDQRVFVLNLNAIPASPRVAIGDERELGHALRRRLLRDWSRRCGDRCNLPRFLSSFLILSRRKMSRQQRNGCQRYWEPSLTQVLDGPHKTSPVESKDYRNGRFILTVSLAICPDPRAERTPSPRVVEATTLYRRHARPISAEVFNWNAAGHHTTTKMYPIVNR